MSDKQECAVCHEIKYFTEFSKDKSILTGYMSTCKQCMKKKKKEYRSNPYNNEKEKMYKKKFRQTEKGKIITKLDNIFYKGEKTKNSYKKLKKLGDYTPRYKYNALVNIYGIKKEIVEQTYGVRIK